MYQLGHLLLPVGTVSLLDAVRNELKELSPLRERQEQLASHLLSPQPSTKQLSTVAADLNCQYNTYSHGLLHYIVSL